MIVKLLNEHHLAFLSLKGGCTGSSESTLVKFSNCWKSHAMAQMLLILFFFLIYSDMEVAKVGGPVYRIGVGGGAASSVQVQGDNKSELDFGAVQRGDAEMEQKLNRVIRACVEMGNKNPIASIHDQGAGGNGNVTCKDLVNP